MSMEVLNDQIMQAAFEPGFFLVILFAMGLNVIRFFIKAQFESGQEEDEDWQILRENEIKEAMQQADTILQSRVGYYRRLSQQGKDRFLARLQVILATKRFYGKEGLKLTPEIEVLTSAAIVQITFGLRSFSLDRFDKIVVYPDVFYNRLLDRNLKGSTSPLGVLRFSWKHLSHGYEVEDDNINLALHETAHALKIIVDEENSYLDTHLDREMAEFFESGEEVRDAILEGKLKLIRKYASTNEHEFFACCVEYFFESPEHFKANLPHLYQRIASILKQDPTNVERDFEWVDRLIEKQRDASGRLVFGGVKRAEVDDDAYGWLPWLLVAGLFLGIPIGFFMHLSLESADLSIALFHLTVIVGGVALFRRRLLLSGYTSVGSFALVILLGWWPVVASSALVINNVVPFYEYAVVEEVKLEWHDRDYYFVNPKSELRMVRRGVKIDRVIASMVRDSNGRIKLISNVHYGLFGLRVYDDHGFTLIYDDREIQ